MFIDIVEKGNSILIGIRNSYLKLRLFWGKGSVFLLKIVYLKSE